MTQEERARLEPRFNRALALRDSGDWDGACMALEQLAEEFPDYPPILGMVGSIYLHLDDYAQSLLWYQRTVDLSPKSELASLGLFHSLWITGQQTSALAEMRRYLALGESDEYEQLSRELRQAGIVESELD